MHTSDGVRVDQVVPAHHFQQARRVLHDTLRFHDQHSRLLPVAIGGADMPAQDLGVHWGRVPSSRILPRGHIQDPMRLCGGQTWHSRDRDRGAPTENQNQPAETAQRHDPNHRRSRHHQANRLFGNKHLKSPVGLHLSLSHSQQAHVFDQ